MPNEKEIKALEDGIITVFHGLGEEAARAICVGELKPFGDAVIALEKRKLEAVSTETPEEFGKWLVQ